ncbi:MAG: divergent polysaccharide deacetylase family protein [Thermodesulfobacteriota bacterium]|nr:divergent polysaccharide deacetylase family protein [Thermodesulfobacteriota bacterium]
MIDRNHTFIFILFPILLGCFVLFGLFFLFHESITGTSMPVYEEGYSTGDDLIEQIREIDSSIYESLYDSGTRKEDIFFLDVQPKHLNDYVWDFTSLLVKCMNLQSALDLSTNIRRNLSELGPSIVIREEKESEAIVICHVFAQGCYTHKITMRSNGFFLPRAQGKGKVAIIIDDLGYDLKIASSFIQMDIPLSFSVLPSATFTDSIVRQVNQKGGELILHLPMEPKKYPSVDPGPGALLLSMTRDELKDVLDRDLGDIPGARGVNNHMGSSFSEDRRCMKVVLKELKERGLYFVDSLTTNRTVGYELAKEMGLPVTKRSVFLDNNLEKKAIRMQMERLFNIARHSGSAVGIGHPHQETLDILNEYHAKMKREIQLVPVSELARLK